MRVVPEMLRFAAGFVVVALVAVFCPQPAYADFGSPRPVTPAGSNASEPRQATDRQGDSAFVWLQDGKVKFRIRKADGSRTMVRTVAEIGAWISVIRIAVDDDGDGVVIWDAMYRPNTQDETTRLHARRFTRSGRLGPARPISPVDQYVLDANAAVRPSGRAIVTWIAAAVDPDLDRGHVPWVREFRMDGGRGPVRNVGPGPNSPPPTVATDRFGRGVLLWSDKARLFVRRVHRTGGLGPTRTIMRDPGDVDLSPVGLGLHGDNGIVVFWQRWDGDSASGQVWARRLSPTLRPRTKPRLISRRGQDATSAAVDTDSQGDSVVTWGVGHFEGAFARYVRHDGVLGKVVKLGGGGMGPVLLGDDGRGVVVSTAYRMGLRRVVRVTRVRRNGTFGGTIRVGLNDYDTRITGGVSRSGRVTIAWEQIHGDRIMAVTGS
jgi:hypothetical protein